MVKRKIAWLAVSCLMVISLVLAACAPAAVEEEEAAPVVKKEAAPVEKKEAAPAEKEEVAVTEEKDMVQLRLTKLDGTVVTKSVERPRYGGVFVSVQNSDPAFFDGSFGHIGYTITSRLTNDAFVFGDWARGLAGTGEASWLIYMYPGQVLLTGGLAESFELPDNETLIFHIRPGVYYALNPDSEASRLVGGREMTVDDVLFSIKYLWADPRSLYYVGYEFESITATDKWTIEIKTKPDAMFRVWRAMLYLDIHPPPEVVEEYGDMNDWRNSVGQGAWMLTDYVTGSSVTFKRNPNYWMKDPLHPENTLPYLDGVKWLIIPDASTRMAALRTAKIDSLGTVAAVTWEDGESLLKTTPELEYVSYLPGVSAGIAMLNYLEPYTDQRVRKALMMAIDHEAIARDYYEGNADILVFPWAPLQEHADRYIPLEQLPESIQEQFGYHPDKAKQLLADAGYPDGFKAKLLLYDAQVDLASIVKDYWSKIGVDLELDVREIAAYRSMYMSKDRQFETVFVGLTYATASPYSFLQHGNLTNYSEVNDPYLEERLIVIDTAFPDEARMAEIYHDGWTEYVIDQAFYIALPGDHRYNLWWPWVKGYHGEYAPGYGGEIGNFVRYIWIDQDLKEAMTGRR